MSRYPSEPELEAIEKWDYRDIKGCFKYLQEIWAYPEYFTLEDNKYNVSTGGWSGNEDLLAALKSNHMIWMITWEQSRRGGHYIFDMERVNE